MWYGCLFPSTLGLKSNSWNSSLLCKLNVIGVRPKGSSAKREEGLVEIGTIVEGVGVVHKLVFYDYGTTIFLKCLHYVQ